MLTNLLPRKIATSRFRLLWLALLLLAPLAYAAGAYLFLKNNLNAQIRLAVDRAQAFAQAASYLSSKGLNVTGWERYCIAEGNDDLHFYYEADSQRGQAQHFAPALTIKVLFRKPDSSESVEAFLAPDGRALGFSRRIWQTDKQAPLAPTEAQELAEARLRARPEAAFANFSAPPQVQEISDKGDLTRRYTWQWKTPTLPELKAETVISVYGNRVIGEHVETKLDESFIKQKLDTQHGLKIASRIAFGLVLALAVIFGLYRFVKRARQKELSFLRIFLITSVIAIGLNLVILLSDVALYPTAALVQQAVPPWQIYISSGIVFFLVALFIGIAYGSGEGDIREAYPGKLTSIDTMLLGKFYARNIGRGVVWGFALSGWLWLALQVALLAWVSKPYVGEGYLPFVFFYADLPILLVLTTWQTDVILVTVVGLLLPLPFLRRCLRPESKASRWLSHLTQYLPAQWGTHWAERSSIILLALFAWIISQGPQLDFRPETSILAIAAIKTAFLLLAFFKFDLLTAVATIAIPTYLKFILTALVQPAPAIHQTGVIGLIIAVSLLLAAMLITVKGQWFSDEEVRPLYAKNLAERVSLQAEVSAARVAQERLLPQRLPISPSFTVAASCVPAHEVGGDFYDFFEVGPQQLGMLVAEGGGRGLGSALSIAYAKGFLMPKIGSQSSGDDSPTEVMRGLQDRLTQMMARDDEVGLAYLVLDTSDGVLRYARTGQYPQVLLGRQQAGSAEVTITAPQEHELKFSMHGATDQTVSVIEGRTEVEAGDHLIIYTGGLVEVWQNNKQTPAAEFAQLLKHATKIGKGSHSEELQSALFESVNRCFKLVRKQELSDDLTAVVVRVEQVGAQIEEGLAEA